MTLSRNLRRRLILYGCAAAVAALVLISPRLATRLVPAVKVSRYDLDAVASDEATKLLVRYLKIDTSNPPGRTREAVELWKELFACEGLPYTVTGEDPERPIFVARLAGRRPGEALLLLHHMDVVPAGDPGKWTYPPFGAEGGKGLEAFYLYGRGVIDMKNLGIAHFLAIASLHRLGIVPERGLVFVAEPGEETFTPEAGIGWIVRNRPDLLEGVTDAFTEGGINEVLTTELDRFGIETFQKADLGLTVGADSRELLEAFRKLLAAKDASFPTTLLPEVAEFFRFIGPARGDVWGRLVMNPKRLLGDDAFAKSAPDVYRSLLKDSLYSEEIVAGKGGGFEMNVAWTLLPGRSVQAAKGQLEAWASAGGLGVRTRFVTRDAQFSPQEGPAWEALVRALQLDPVQAEVGTYLLSGAYTNSNFLRAEGYRSYGVSPFAINIYDAARAHGPNERIHMPAFLEGVERMKRIVREFATSP